MTLLLLLILFLLILNPSIASTSVLSSCSLWFNTLVPVLLPSMIIMDFLSNSKLLNMISFYLFPIFKIIFNIRYPKSVSLIILSVISGAPSSTKLINHAYMNKEIDLTEANSLIYSFSTLSIAYTIFILNSFNINYAIFILLYIISTIIIMRVNNKGDMGINASPKEIKINLLNTFYSSISKNTNILFTILGIMISFNVLLSLFLNNLSIYPIFEVLSGHQILLALNINKKLKNIILAFSLMFLGFSLHLQIRYVYDKFNYIKFISSKLVQALFVSWFLLI